jgi:hypothetical protein
MRDSRTQIHILHDRLPLTSLSIPPENINRLWRNRGIARRLPHQVTCQSVRNKRVIRTLYKDRVSVHNLNV